MSQTWNLPLANSIVVSTFPGHLNDVGASLASKFSGTTAPASPVTWQWFLDTDDNSLSAYDGASWNVIFPDFGSAYGGLMAASAATLSANMSAGNFKITSLDDATAAADAVNKGQVDARERVAVIYLGDVSATSDFKIWCGGPAITITKISLAVVTTIAADGVNYWDINVYNHTAGSEPDHNILASDFSTSGTALTADVTNDLGAFASGKDTVSADDCLELQLVKNSSPTSLDQACLCIKYKVTT